MSLGEDAYRARDAAVAAFKTHKKVVFAIVAAVVVVLVLTHYL